MGRHRATRLILIYPKRPIFQNTISIPITAKEKLLTTLPEAIRNDEERVFGVLQAKWHIIAYPGCLLSIDYMAAVMRCVIILHNMMVEEND